MKLTLKTKSWRYKLLSIPLYTTMNQEKAKQSRFHYRAMGVGRYQLRVLGVLHGLFGLTLEIEE